MPILESIGLSVAEEVLKGVAKLIPHALAKWRVQNFFGKSAFKDNFYIVIDPYEHKMPRIGNRYLKKFYGRRPDLEIIGEDKVLGSCHIRTIGYATAFFGAFRNPLKPIKIVADEDVRDMWDGGFICIGSADSNIKTYDIERFAENTFYTLSWDQAGGRCFKVGSAIYNIENNEDVGLLIKLKNPRHSDHILILCQGLGEWGSTGALYYLFHNFGAIYSRSKSKDFCKIIRTQIGSDESSHEIAHIEK